MGARRTRTRIGRFLTLGTSFAVLLTPTGGLAQEIRVTLLGTGDPRPIIDRFGPSILVEAGSEKLLIDAGRGAAQRFAQTGSSFGDLTGVFLTHLHSDHVVGLPDVWLTGWLMSRRPAPLEVWGPAGTADMAAHLEAAYRFDRDIRARDDSAPAGGGRLLAHDVGEGVVLDRNGIKVTAFEVDHSPVRPALGYRVDFGGRAVVLSGDTRHSPNLIRFARAADLLIHEVAAASDSDLAHSERLRAVVGHHTTPQQAGDVFRRAAPRLAVYSHLTLFSGLSPEDVVRLTRQTYTGPLVVGEDLMRFRVGERVGLDRSRSE
jgi:ribonuclease Z